METPASTRRHGRRRAAVALVALATALPLFGTATPSGAAASPAAAAYVPLDPGDSAKFAKLNRQIEQLEKELGGDLAKLKDIQYAAKKAHQKSKTLEKDLIEARSIAAQLAATQYMRNGEDPTVTFLSASNPSELLSNASLVSHMAQNQHAKVEQIQKLINEQAQARKQAEAKMTQVKKEIKDLKSRRTKIEALVKKYKPESPVSGLGGVTSRMLKTKNAIDLEFGPFPTIGCVRGGVDAQDHGTGQACDFMVTTGGVMASGSAQTQGDQAAQYAISNASSLGVKYVIWRQRIYDMRSPGWRAMENRGGNTANHYDHVHISVF
ncbi:hypothetical protein [Actinomadura sp. 7K507]|uniref:coiled-coil domain-containing protein n=1 Tax=Actinomadura sp. 7K507 TaxID=2530365 RepID=UPI00104DB187|nr:hypothetical protein [Actinomadura sp. 7K507]TDC93536.1 hypothetical protein E1285_09830 [Actinomadura sp. 7K507]